MKTVSVFDTWELNGKRTTLFDKPAECIFNGSMIMAAVNPYIAQHGNDMDVRVARLIVEAPALVISLREIVSEFAKDGHGGEFEDGEHPMVDRARALLARCSFVQNSAEQASVLGEHCREPK